MRIFPIFRFAFSGFAVAVLITPAAAGKVSAFQQQEIEIPGRQDADLVIELQQAIDVALDKSFGIFQLQQQFLQYAYLLEASQRALRTRIDLTSSGLPNISQSIDARLVGQPPELSYLRRNSSWGDVNLIISQPLITDGNFSFWTGFLGSQAVQNLTSGQEIKNRSIQPTAGISFRQPLFQYNQIKGQLRSDELSVQGQRLRYTEDELRQINIVTRSFYNLFQQQQRVEIAAENYRQSEINYQTGVRRYQAAQQSEVVILGLQVDMANVLSDLESEKTALERLSFAFNRVVGLPLETTIWVESTLEYRPVEVDVDRALELAMQNRSDVQRQQIQLEQDNLTLKQTISQNRPDLQFSASYRLTGNSALGTLGFDDPWSEHLSASLNSDNRSPFTNISLTLQVPILDGGRNSAIVERRMSMIRQQERQIDETRADLRVEVINRVRAVEGAMRMVEILEENLQIARTSYQISQQQFERGDIDLESLLRAQDQRRNTEDRHLGAWIAFEMAKADLKEITLWDWETNESVTQRTQFPVPFAK